MALLLAGLGWNCLFVGGTSLVVRVAEPIERGRVQGFADLMTMTTVAVASLFAGAIHSQFGWEALTTAALAPVGIVAIAIAWLGLITKRQQAGAV